MFRQESNNTQQPYRVKYVQRYVTSMHGTLASELTRGGVALEYLARRLRQGLQRATATILLRVEVKLVTCAQLSKAGS